MLGITLSLSDADWTLLRVAGALTAIFIGSIASRRSSEVIHNRRKKNETIEDILMPFNDAILNLENENFNYICIANSFFRNHEIAIACAKAIASQRKT